MEKIENLFLSVGAMKAGTTWVYDKLQHHPQIHFSREKEVHYFACLDGIANSLDSVKRKAKTQRIINNAAKELKAGKLNHDGFMDLVNWYLNYSCNDLNDNWYINLFDADNVKDFNVYCADFSNLNCFLSEKGWNHVKSLAKNIKTIYILRDPVARLWSHYKFHLQFIGHKSLGTLDQDFDLFKKIIEKKWFIRNSYYSENIKSLEENLEPDQFRIYYLEDISKNPSSFFESIESYLKLESFDFSNMDVDERKNKSISKGIPDDWLVLIYDVLKDEIKELKKMSIWHESWTDLC